MRRNAILVMLGIFVLSILSGCVTGNSSQSFKTKDELSSAIYKNSSYSVEERVEDLISRMTLEEKIGQMMQVDRSFLRNEVNIEKYFLGSVLSGGGSCPAINSPEVWAEMSDRYQSHALKTRLGIPILFGIDAVHGHNQVEGAVVFPHNIGLGCTRNPELVQKAARITAIEVAGTGINWTFSPCLAVPQDERWGRTYEGFGENPELVKIMGEAEVRGYQGTDLKEKDTILACAKHYVGDGGTLGGVDRGDTQVNEETLRNIHLPGYVSAINAGVGSIMASFSSWNGRKIHGQEYLLTAVLKNELGFEGILLSDWGAVKQLPGGTSRQIKKSVNAGIDMIMIPDSYTDYINRLSKLVQNSEVPISRIDDAVRRILKIKFRLGLFESPFTDRSYTAMIGSEEHRAVARECVRESGVLLKNNKNMLPLSKQIKRIHLAGKNADNLGYQCGGWTVSWQGKSGKITKGTTILEGIKLAVSPSTKITFSEDGTGAKGSDVCIVVIGETPYAEFEGDSEDLSLSPEDVSALNEVKKTGVPIVVVLVTGRPLVVTDYLNNWDALLVVWLPGSEGQGVADILFGDYNPTGKLSHTWPRDISQVPINYGDEKYDPLFPYGFGLSY